MPPHPEARDLAADALARNERHRAWIRDLLPAARARLSDARDRSLLTELTYGVVRRLGTLDAIVGRVSRRPIARLSVAVRVALRLATYQLVFLDRVPAHAAVNHAVAWTRARGGAKSAGYVNAVLRAGARLVRGPVLGPEDPTRDVPRDDGSAIRLADAVFVDPERDLVQNLSTRFSCPVWLVTRWLAARGPARTQAVLTAGITRPPLALRARDDRDALLRTLRERCPSARASPVPTAILVTGGGEETTALESVVRGEAWVQDATAQRVAPLLAPEPASRVLDLCAAPGGKTLHLTDLLDGRGTVVACDVDEDKVAALAELRSKVRGDVVLETTCVPAEGPLPFEPGSFDAILIDAPCTNTGVLRRRVEARWRLEPGDVLTLARIQRGLLERSLPLLAAGGRLVYTTCSLEPEENSALVAAFLAAHPELERQESLEIPPGRDADGGYAALLYLSSRI